MAKISPMYAVQTILNQVYSIISLLRSIFQIIRQSLLIKHRVFCIQKEMNKTEEDKSEGHNIHFRVQ